MSDPFAVVGIKPNGDLPDEVRTRIAANMADTSKPEGAALSATYVPSAEKGTAGGVARLNGAGKVVDASGAVVDIADATSAVKGKLALAGDLSGSASAPSVVGLGQLRTDVDAITADPANALTTFTAWASRDWVAVQGTPTFELQKLRAPGWTVPKADVYLALTMDFPSNWTKMVVDILWVNQVANTGNVSFSVAQHQNAVGDSIDVSPTGIGVIGAANATPWINTETTVGTTGSPFNLTPGKRSTIRVQRNGSSGSDTLPNAIGILGLRFRKVT